MPTQTFTPGTYAFDHVGKTNIRFVIRSAGGNGCVGDGGGEQGLNYGGGGGGCVVGSIPLAHLTDAVNLMVVVPAGGSEQSAMIVVNGGVNDSAGVIVLSGMNATATDGMYGYLGNNILGWGEFALQGGAGSCVGVDIGGGGGGAATVDADGYNADGGEGALDGSGNPSGGNGGYEGTPGENAYGIGGGGGGGTLYGDPLYSAGAGSGGDGQIILTWDVATGGGAASSLLLGI